MSFELNANSLIKFLNEKGFSPTFQPETNQTYITLKMCDLDVPIFIKITEDSPLLQIMAYLPFEVQHAAFGETARILHLLNMQLDMPGFGMDEKERLMFYRCVIPCLDNKVSTELFVTYLGTLRFAFETFMHIIGAISSGTTTIEDLGKDE